jgi:hypothetical protein
MDGIAASKKQPTFEQFSLANISLSIVSAVSLDHRRWSSARRGSTVQSAIPRRGPSDPSILRERRFEPVSPGSNDPPTRGDRHSPDPVGRQGGRRNGRHRLGSQPGALPSWVGRRRDPLAMQCRYCRRPAEIPIGYYRNVPAASPTGPPDTHRTAGRPGSRRLGDSQRPVCLDRRRAVARPAVHPGGQFRLTSQRRGTPCRASSAVSIARR